MAPRRFFCVIAVESVNNWETRIMLTCVVSFMLWSVNKWKTMCKYASLIWRLCHQTIQNVTEVLNILQHEREHFRILFLREKEWNVLAHLIGCVPYRLLLLQSSYLSQEQTQCKMGERAQLLHITQCLWHKNHCFLIFIFWLRSPLPYVLTSCRVSDLWHSLDRWYPVK